ncbi:hypothetical protein JDV02_004177 [Purpureocillium takamizusanense]|uniref:p-hydroxylaminobenzoate lyase n=1 Tax=Purpureocillium takamizusanense TaxID=2060973 RepID=A0A9Q8QE75_9HYPO|nr:uncharacterized protein JDV02_004177 [Purpureocillium takamizusanense]UNI17863.1 hypothetical protein JDV02_004177 [Purpureocillium takamizusanense]
MTKPDKAAVLDLDKWPAAQKFVSRCAEFFDEVKNLTPGKDLETRLNRDYGPGNAYYDDFCAYIKQGLAEGWVAETEIAGPHYRRGRISPPTERTHFLSITTVYMDGGVVVEEGTKVEDEDGDKDGDGDGVLRGQYHQHPYGEINCVVALDEGAELKGMQGWQGAGWTSPGPGTHHYPEARGGRLVALFFLPAGRISYEATPEMAQPHCV